jgi:hypothetical protein
MRDNIVTHMTPARLRLCKHGLKVGKAAETEVNLIGNGTQTPVSVATNINKGILVKTNGITECSLLFDMANCIRAAWKL